MGLVQIAVVQRSKARHSELLTNIATLICVAVRHCQSTSDSVASPHTQKNDWMAKSFLNKEAMSLYVRICIDIVCMQNIGTRAAGQYSYCPNHILGDIDIALRMTAYTGFSGSARHFTQ